MKKLCLLFSLCPVFLWGQVKINFENGPPEGMEQHPAGRWGVTASNPLEGEYSFHHVFDNNESATDAVSFLIQEPRLDTFIQCSFIVRYDYQPSGSNNWCFYFLSERNAGSMHSNGDNNALMLGVNQTGTDDSLRVYLKEGKEIKDLLGCRFHCENDMNEDPWYFSIIMDPGTGIQVFGGAYPGEMELLGEKDNYKIPEFYPSFIGLSYSYTSSKDRLLSIDGIEFISSAYIDEDPPVLVNVEPAGAKLIEIQFDEEVYESNLTPLSIDLNYEIDSFWIEKQSLFILTSDAPINETKLKYEIKGIFDRKNNYTIYKGVINWYYPERHDLIFSEIMADPSPTVYLPEKEYLEIYNRSVHELDLKDWKLFTGDRQWTLPEIKIPPGSYYFFTSYGDSALYKNSNHAGIFSSNSVISNRQESFLLYTPDHILIDAVPYSRSWYNDDHKAEGGWSLEKADMGNLCGWKNSWKASEAFEGGTPGIENSVKREVRDIDPPFLRHVIRETDSTFILRFNEPLDDKYFELQKDIALAINSSIASLELLAPFFHECRLGINRKFINNSIVLKNIWADCEGNVSLTADSLLIQDPVKAGNTDVIISEVLFSPWPGCPEFIELYNFSDDILSLSDFKICVSKISESPLKGKFLTNEEILFFPGSFLVVARDPEELAYYYDVPDDFQYINWSEFPSLPDKEARITICDRGNSLIDEMIYTGSDHFPLINDSHGVSLERIILDANFGTYSDWHSASSIRGFATPGSLNSQNIRPAEKGSDFTCEYETFTPDNDGYRDVALVNIKMEKEGYVAMIRVFDSSGRLKRTIGNNELLGIEETITWDGRDERGILCSSGIYLIHMEAFHLSGSKKVFKEAVVLSR